MNFLMNSAFELAGLADCNYDKIKAFHLHQMLQSLLMTSGLLEEAEVNKINRTDEGA